MSQEHSSTNDSNSSMNVLSPSPPRTSHPFDYEYDQPFTSIKLDKTIYESAPVARNTIENNRVKIITYRGIKLTSFNVDGRQLLCLPQAFDFFLKNLVGGLHTVYTKLKRLEIVPIVCNVEQVRILRSLGAIQPGVNRCKLLAPDEFDILYDDCTNSGSRPGRPPKRSSCNQPEDYSDGKHLKLVSNLFLRSFSDYKYPFHSNADYLSLPSSSPWSPFNPSPYHPTPTRPHPSISTHQSRSFTIDAMLSQQRDRLAKPIDLSMTTNNEQTSSIFAAQQTTAALENSLQIRNMIEVTVENARRREKLLENEINDLKSEITREHDCRQKLQQDFLQLQRVRTILVKKLKRINRDHACAKEKNDLLTKPPSTAIEIPPV